MIDLRSPRRASACLLFAALAFLSGTAHGDWTQLPGPRGVRTNVLYKNGPVLFVGTDSRGVYRSLDNGSHWQPANTGIENFAIHDLVVAGSNLLAAASSSCGSGIYKSTDNGGHWLFTGFPLLVNSFGIKDGQVYAAALDLDSSIYRSTNNGDSWQQLPSPIQSGNEIFVAGNAILVAEDNFIWRSTDDGGSWDVVEQFALSGVHSFTQSGNRIYGAGVAGLFLSTDGGAHWEFSVFDGGALSLTSIGNTIFVGNGRVSESTDSGVTWHDASNNLGRGPIAALLYDGTRVWAGTSQDTAGIYVTTNGGANWLPSATGLPVAPTIRSLIAFNDQIFAGMQSDGVYRSSDHGDTWAKVGLNNPGLVNQLVLSFCSQSGNLFAGSGNGVFRSSDGGQTFQTVVNGFPTGGQIFVPSLTVSGNHLLAAASIQYPTSTIDAIFYSSDSGASWHQGTLPIPSIFVSCVASNGSSTAFAGSYAESSFNTGLYKSTDSGVTWIARTSSLMADIDELAVSANGNNVLAGTLFSAFYSLDGGESFAGSSPPAGGIFTYTLRDDFVFAGNVSGEFYSTDGGAVWLDANQGFPGCRPSVEESCANSSYLFVGAFENGIWRRPLSDFGIVTAVEPVASAPATTSLSQNYPNPFHPTTNIAFSLSAPGRVRLTVYDVLGRQIATLIDGPRAAGPHVVPFDGEQLANGVYLYRLEGEGFVSTRSMVLAK